MKTKYVVVGIEYREFERYIERDYKMIFYEIDKNSRFDTLAEAESEMKNKIKKYKEFGKEFTILTLYSS